MIFLFLIYFKAKSFPTFCISKGVFPSYNEKKNRLKQN